MILDPAYEAYTAEVKSQAKHLVENVIPGKITELSQLIQSDQLNLKIQQESLRGAVSRSIQESQDGNNNEEKACKKRKLKDGKAEHKAAPDEQVKCNEKILKLNQIVLTYADDLLEHANVMQSWAQISIPISNEETKLESTRELSIHSHVNNILSSIEEKAELFSDFVSSYLIRRGRLFTEVFEFPQLDDYREAVYMLDVEQFKAIRNNINNIRSHYAMMYQTTFKHWDVLMNAGNSNESLSTSMYQ